MALIELARRSATIVADEHLIVYELPRDAHVRLLLANLSRELARRLRRTSEDLRNRT